MHRTIFISLLISVTAASLCQTEALIEEITMTILENGNETDTERLVETLTELLSDPLNLNSATESSLSQCGLFTPFQVFGILKYREKYGQFFSIYEIAAIPGFNEQVLEIITPLLTVSSTFSIEKFKKNKGMLLSNIALKFPSTMAYIESDSGAPVYPGSPLKITHRLKYEVGAHWTIGLAYEKDPGEKWILEKQAEHTAGFLQYKSAHFIKQMILGNFRVHRGMGLIHGLGFNSRNSGVQLNGFRRSYAKPFSSTMEYGYYRGIYVETGFKQWRTDIFWSLRPEELSLYSYEDGNDLFDCVRESGLHRTSTEINGIGLAQKQAAGLSINHSSSHFNLGFASAWAGMGLTSAGIDSIGSSFPINTKSNYSFYGVGFGSSFEVYSEIAIDQQFRHAILLGGNFEFNPAFSSSVSFRNYQIGYTGQSPNAFSSGTSPENERGMNIGFSIVPFPNAGLYLNTDVSQELNGLSLKFVPGILLHQTLRFTYKWENGPDFEFRISNKEQNILLENNRPGNGILLGGQTSRYRLQLTHNFSDYLKTSSRIELSMLQKGDIKSKGNMMYQQLTIKFVKALSLTYRFTLFSSPEWENRIYTYEPGVRYSFLFPALSGKGSRNILVSSLDFGHWGTIRGKIGYTEYSHKHNSGTGNDLRNGDKVWDAEIQLQVDF